jgi:hypothetical protein
MIWYTKQDAINPYTRQPFYIFNVIPQTELKQQMYEYILNNNITLSLGLEVIADYTKILNQTEMKHLLDELVFAVKQCLCLLKKKRRCNRNKNRKPDDEELEHWKARGMVDNCINYLLRNKGFPIYYLVELALSVLSEWE